MKKIRLLPLLLAVLLLLTACSPGNTERGKEYGYFTYSGIEWGIDEDEFLKVIGKSKDDFEYTYTDNPGKDTAVYTLKGVDVFGKEADMISFNFVESMDGEMNFTSVYIGYEDASAFEKIADAYRADVNSQGVEVKETYSLLRSDDQQYEVDSEEELFAEGVDIAKKVYRFDADKFVFELPQDLIDKANEGFEIYKADRSGIRGDVIDFYGDYPLTYTTVTYTAGFENGEIYNDMVEIRMQSAIGNVFVFADLAK